MRTKNIPLNLIIPDPDVQFDFSFDPRRVKKMAAEWDSMLAGEIDVVPLNSSLTGFYGAFTGRHRHAAAQLAGESTIRCAVWDSSLSIQDKHRIKIGKDRDRRNVRAVEMFLNEVGAGQVDSCDILNLCEEHGFTIGKCSAGKPFTQFECVQTLRAIYRQGRDHFRRVLTLDTLWMGEPKTNSTNWVGGLSVAVSQDWLDRVSPSGYQKMKDLIPAKVLREATGLATNPGSGLGNTRGTAPHIADKLRRASGVRRTS